MELLRAIHRLLSANRVTSCAVFLAKPRQLTCVNPNCRLITRKRMLDFGTDARLHLLHAFGHEVRLDERVELAIDVLG